MEAIKDTIQKVIRNLGSKNKSAAEDNPVALLGRMFSKKDLRHIKFSYFKKGILVLNVDSSARLYTLTLQKEPLLAKLRGVSPKAKDIRFRIGEVV